MMNQLAAEVTFLIDDSPETLAKLSLKAREIDLAERGKDDTPDTYTLPQALAVIWAVDPTWLHENALTGWTFDKAVDHEGIMRPPFES